MKKYEVKKPTTARGPRAKTLPVNVKSYFKNGKRISGYKRAKPGGRRIDEGGAK